MNCYNEITDIWGFRRIDLIKPFHAKGGRSVILVDTDVGEFVVKVFPAQLQEDAVARYTSALSYLAEKSVKIAPKIIATLEDQFFAKVGGRWAYVMEYVSGRPAGETPDDEYRLGQAAAILHSFDDYRINAQVHSSVQIEKRNQTMQELFAEYPFKAAYDDLIDSLPDFTCYRQAFIHTDIGPHNAIKSHDDDVVFVDFDDAGRGSVYVDIGYPLITQFVRFGGDSQLRFDSTNAQAFYSGYASSRSLDEYDAELIFQGAVFMQLMYMPCYGNEAVNDIWEILQYALRYKDKLISAIL